MQIFSNSGPFLSAFGAAWRFSAENAASMRPAIQHAKVIVSDAAIRSCGWPAGRAAGAPCCPCRNAPAPRRIRSGRTPRRTRCENSRFAAFLPVPRAGAHGDPASDRQAPRSHAVANDRALCPSRKRVREGFGFGSGRQHLSAHCAIPSDLRSSDTKRKPTTDSSAINRPFHKILHCSFSLRPAWKSRLLCSMLSWSSPDPNEKLVPSPVSESLHMSIHPPRTSQKARTLYIPNPPPKLLRNWNVLYDSEVESAFPVSFCVFLKSALLPHHLEHPEGLDILGVVLRNSEEC